MIRAKLLIENKVTDGDIDTVNRWQAEKTGKIWLDIQDILSEETGQLLMALGCDPLAIKDASRERHPPKIEAFDQQTFLLFRGISELGEDLQLVPQQLAFFVGDNCLISFHRGPSVSIDYYWALVDGDPELLADPGRLALRMLHYASGRYLETILGFEDQLGELEDILLSGAAEAAMKELVSYRSRLRVLRRVFSYHQRLADAVMHGTGPHLSTDDEQNQHERRDLYDRCERLYSLCTMYYEICGDLLDGHISLSSHRLNNTMKILTIITAIFVPLSFLAGIYGMNFENMPELGFKYSYFILLGVMASLSTGMLFLFRKLHWL